MRKTRHKVTFLADADVEAVVLAQLGGSTQLIQRRTGLRPHQIAYRLTKAKVAEGLPKGTGFRGEWRNGTSLFYMRISKMFVPGMRKHASMTLPPKFISVPAAARP